MPEGQGPSSLDTDVHHCKSKKIIKQKDHSLPFAAEMHSSHQVHKILKRHSIFIHPSHHSLFTIPVQVAHSRALSQLLPSNHPQLPFPPSQLCCHNTHSCDNIGRTLVLFLNFQIAIIFQSKMYCPNSPFWFIILLPNYHIH